MHPTTLPLLASSLPASLRPASAWAGWFLDPPNIPLLNPFIDAYLWAARLEGFLVGLLVGAFFGLFMAGVMVLLARK